MDNLAPLHTPPPPRVRPDIRRPAPAPGFRVAGLFALAVALGLGSVVLWRTVTGRQTDGLDPDAMPRVARVRGELADDEKATIDLFKQRSASVVFITTADTQRDRFSFDVTEIPRGTGTGVVWSEDGHVVTNYHVIEQADRFRVTHGEQSWEATLVGALADKDLAVLKLRGPTGSLRPIPLGTSHDLQVGQKVLAIGNPFGLDQTLTTGVIAGWAARSRPGPAASFRM